MPDPLTLLSAGLAEAKAARATLDRAITALEHALQQGVQDGVNTMPPVAVEESEHRRLHRPGRAPKIDVDPDLRAFILARIDRLTFDQIAAEIALHFPASRRVGRSTIWEWRRRQRKMAGNAIRN